MAVEDADYINQLQQDSPSASDSISEGDKHLTTIKKVLKQSFPNVNQPVNVIHTSESPPVLSSPGTVWFDTSTGLIKFRSSGEPEDQEWIIMGHGEATGVGNLLKFTKNDYTPEIDYREPVFTLKHTFLITPVSTKSTMYFDISGECVVGGAEAVQENHLKFRDETQDIDISLGQRILSFNFPGDATVNEISGMFNIKFWKENNDGNPFTVGAYGKHIGDGFSRVLKMSAVCQEIS